MYLRALVLLGLFATLRLAAQTPEWIWGAKAFDGETRHFRKTFTIPAGTQGAILTVAADNEAEVRLNGKVVARNTSWNQPRTVKLASPKAGPATLEVTAKNEGDVAGLLVKLELLGGGKSPAIVTDASWQTSADGKSGWVAAKSIGALGVQPWGDVLKPAIATPAESLEVAKDFKVELLRSAQPEEGSWVSMTVDPKGRLIVSPQGGEPMERITLDEAGHVAKVETIDLPVTGAMGLLCAYDALYVNGRGAEGYHLYRLTDTNGDDKYDRVELLRKWEGGDGEHGAHGIVKGPDGHLYIVCGNFVDVPTDLAPTTRVKNYADDLVLPRMEDGNGFGAGRKPPGGFVLRVDKDGKDAELYAAGERNTYDIAFNRDGELFGFDSDMEWDWGAPWYRPTRVYHVVSGGDQGFREGSAKYPEYYSDSLPAVVNIGIGSPTGVKFGTGAKFPAKYQQAMFIMDWSYGRIMAVHLKETNSTYTGTFETFIRGKPLNVTDLEIGPDGALYFTTGGRGTQAGLYRVSYVGTERTEPLNVQTMQVTKAQQARRLRHQLEELAYQPIGTNFALIGAGISSPDRFLRNATRLALENQPSAVWRHLALSENIGRRAFAALLALARTGTKEDQAPLLKQLLNWPLNMLNEEGKLSKLRVIEVSFARWGIPNELRKPVADQLAKDFPAKTWPLNREISQILVALDAPGIVQKVLDLRDAAPTQEEQLHYQAILRKARSGWTMDDRKRYFAWFNRPAQPGSEFISRSTTHPDFFVQWFKDVGLEASNGASLDNFLKNLRKEAVASLSDNEKGELAAVIAGQEPVPVKAPAKARTFVKDWKTDDLLPALAEAAHGRNYARGRATFAAAQCVVCHQINGQGGAVGPDLTGVGTRYAPADVLKSITEPSLVISEQYQALTFTLKDDTEVTGRLLEDTADKLVVLTDPLNGGKTEVKKAAVKSREASKISPMPEGLLATFSKDEILDLLAYLLSNGKEDAPAFKN
ncbi:MAG TPA: c-type cytochrome [Candidatus Limnocylindria bacterium]|jgi:putative heme-binding domain-containing protein|nr:c-type cytochrome [Candidatus Limnocylindria bacterium]